MTRHRTLVGISFGLVGAAALAGGCAKDQSFVDQQNAKSAPRPGVQVGPKPQFGSTRLAGVAPPPITGGTLILARDGRVIAADPDLDQVYIVNLDAGSVQTVALQAGDEPGRLAEDAAGHVHVALRRGGALLTIELATGNIIARRQICAAPRGVAYNAAKDTMVVACATGEVVTLPASGGAPLRTVQVERDLRDVVIVNGNTFVTEFRNVNLLQVDDSGQVINRQQAQDSNGMSPAIAWRAIHTTLAPSDLSGQPRPSGPTTNASSEAVAVIHQRARTEPVSTQSGGYGEPSTPGCESSIVESTVSFFDVSGNGFSANPGPVIPGAVLPVDIAASPDGQQFAVVAAGNGKTPSLPSLFVLQANQLAFNSGCAGNPGGPQSPPQQVQVQAIAVVFVGQSHLVVQTRAPSRLFVIDPLTLSFDSPAKTIVLSSHSVEDTGHSIFHSNAGGFVACASCHAEGGEDGRTWTFTDSGPRRTQLLRGTLAGTAPYHWNGDMHDLTQLSHEVFVKRMAGDELQADQVDALQRWLFALPEPPIAPASDQAAVARGAALFNDARFGCSTCHSGPKFTNNATVDVGTGGQFQVPSLLGVAWRAPYLHDGCATTLRDRFDPNQASCNGGESHGHTSQLASGQVDDLVSFLSTL